MKLTVLGGSGVATPALLAALAEAWTFPGHPPLQVVLHGRSPDKLATVAQACRGAAGPALALTTETDLRRAVEGADVVLNQVRVGGLRARAFDESFPQEFGIPGEETLGPGGFANGYRTLPVVLEHARAVEQASPACWLVNLTNPAGMVRQAVAMATRVRCFAVCESPDALALAAGRLVTPHRRPRADYLGMNHVGWLTRLGDGRRDLLPEVLSRLEELPGAAVEADLAQALGVLPLPYLRYYYHPDAMLASQRGRPTRAEALSQLERDLLAGYAAGADALPLVQRRGAAWYRAAVVPALVALAGGPSQRMVLGVGNGGRVPWLPPQVTIEAPLTLDSGGPGRPRVTQLPPDPRGLLAAHAAFEALTVEGLLEHSEEKLLRALVANPLVPSVEVARRILHLVRQKTPELLAP